MDKLLDTILRRIRWRRPAPPPPAARPLGERELLAGLDVPDDSPLLRSVLALIAGERELARRRLVRDGATDAELRAEAGRMAALDALEADIRRGVERARAAAAPRGSRGARR